jgi:hypothetical protein
MMKIKVLMMLSFMMLALNFSLLPPSHAAQADDATYDITSSGPANPKIVQVSTDQETHTSSVSLPSKKSRSKASNHNPIRSAPETAE